MRRLRHDDGLLARRAIDLHPGIARVALDVLSALRAGKFKFSHNVFSIGRKTSRPVFLVGDNQANSFFSKFASPTMHAGNNLKLNRSTIMLNYLRSLIIQFSQNGPCLLPAPENRR